MCMRTGGSSSDIPGLRESGQTHTSYSSADSSSGVGCIGSDAAQQQLLLLRCRLCACRRGCLRGTTPFCRRRVAGLGRVFLYLNIDMLYCGCLSLFFAARRAALDSTEDVGRRAGGCNSLTCVCSELASTPHVGAFPLRLIAASSPCAHEGLDGLRYSFARNRSLRHPASHPNPPPCSHDRPSGRRRWWRGRRQRARHDELSLSR